METDGDHLALNWFLRGPVAAMQLLLVWMDGVLCGETTGWGAAQTAVACLCIQALADPRTPPAAKPPCTKVHTQYLHSRSMFPDTHSLACSPWHRCGQHRSNYTTAHRTPSQPFCTLAFCYCVAAPHAASAAPHRILAAQNRPLLSTFASRQTEATACYALIWMGKKSQCSSNRSA